ncbi:hypothetical protein PRI8871_02092 [Pseudoprimorskyibacter insulae]|uniref:Multidrug resistance protein MdtN n=1 Tax=Pseudoprimorskyibacter insulae TaxID=1695997 RepID=A0A2R8AWN6_9RHOB|nr:hypothetical protein PRI8871_02092 [Pseudoprimorskyibacter insulae]
MADQPDLAAFLSAWLSLQVALLPGAMIGAVRAGADAGWPNAGAAEPLADPLSEAAEANQGTLSDVGNGTHVIAYPVRLDGQAVGAVAVMLRAADETALLTAMRHLQWGAVWVEARVRLDRLGQGPAQASTDRFALDMLARALDAPRYKPSARALATALADRLGVDRVSVAWQRGGRSKIAAMSYTARITGKLSHPRQVQAAMDEALALKHITVWPRVPGDLMAYEAHDALARAQQLSAIVTVPLMHSGQAVGALCIEHSQPLTWNDQMLAKLDVVAAAVAPVLEQKRLMDQGPVGQGIRALGNLRRSLLGPDHAGLKLTAVAALAATALFYVWTEPYAIVAEAQVEGAQLRAVTAQIDGFLAASHARPGDQVARGQVLAELDDRDLQLEKLQLTAEARRYAVEYELALSEQNRAEMRIASSRRDQAEARLALIGARLDRTKLDAPFDGIIVAGDPSQMVGSAVQVGQVLYEVAPAGAFRLRLEVPEDQIADLAGTETGQVVLTSFPNHPFSFTIQRIIPIGEVVDGRNVFAVQAQPTGDTALLRPGLRGAARITLDDRRVIWIWTRRLQDWARMTLWRWS